MALGTSLASDLTTAFTTFTKIINEGLPEEEIVPREAIDFSTDIATAIDNYLVGGVYAAGNFTFAGSMTPSDLSLPSSGTVNIAAAAWALALKNYFSSGTTTPLPANSAEAIVFTTVEPTLEAALLTIFADTTKTASQQAALIASAIASAVATISATYTITAVPTVVPVPPPAIV